MSHSTFTAFMEMYEPRRDRHCSPIIIRSSVICV